MKPGQMEIIKSWMKGRFTWNAQELAQLHRLIGIDTCSRMALATVLKSLTRDDRGRFRTKMRPDIQKRKTKPRTAREVTTRPDIEYTNFGEGEESFAVISQEKIDGISNNVSRDEDCLDTYTTPGDFSGRTH